MLPCQQAEIKNIYIISDKVYFIPIYNISDPFCYFKLMFSFKSVTINFFNLRFQCLFNFSC